MFAVYVGPDYAADWPVSASFGFMLRWDLMKAPADLGRMVLAVLDAHLIVGPSRATLEDGRGLPWRFRLWIRSDAGEIAQRLAGQDDGSEAPMRARARAFIERRPVDNPVSNSPPLSPAAPTDKEET